MSDQKPDPEFLRDLGENTTNVANAWAGARDFLSRGLKEWVKRQMGADRLRAVRAAVAACALVAPRYPEQPAQGLPGRSYIDGMLAQVRRWLEDPSEKNSELVRSMLDVTRQAHAWQREEDAAPFWILEAVDHASLAVWAGAKSSYIVPMDFATCASRAVACVLHAMLDAGEPEMEAVDVVTAAVRTALDG
jgi:hypothetical protein